MICSSLIENEEALTNASCMHATRFGDTLGLLKGWQSTIKSALVWFGSGEEIVEHLLWIFTLFSIIIKLRKCSVEVLC